MNSKTLWILIFALLFSLNSNAVKKPILSLSHEEDKEPNFTAEAFLSSFKKNNSPQDVNVKDMTQFSEDLQRLKFSEMKVYLVFARERTTPSLSEETSWKLTLKFVIYNKNGKADLPIALVYDQDPNGPNLDYGTSIQTLEAMRANVYNAFLFNDPYQDLTERGVSYSAEWIQPEFMRFRIQELLKEREKYKEQDKYLFAYKQSFNKGESGAALDFVRTYVDKLYVINGIAYNRFDMGNFTWGLAMKTLGFSYLEVKTASELNGFLFTRKQNGQGHGIILSGDSDADQSAIWRGYTHQLLPLIEED